MKRTGLSLLAVLLIVVLLGMGNPTAGQTTATPQPIPKDAGLNDLSKAYRVMFDQPILLPVSQGELRFLVLAGHANQLIRLSARRVSGNINFLLGVMPFRNEAEFAANPEASIPGESKEAYLAPVYADEATLTVRLPEDRDYYLTAVYDEAGHTEGNLSLDGVLSFVVQNVTPDSSFVASQALNAADGSSKEKSFALTFGKPITASLTTNAPRYLSFAGKAGQKVRLSVARISGNFPVALNLGVGPDEQADLSGNYVEGGSMTFTLPDSATYLIQVSNNRDALIIGQAVAGDVRVLVELLT